MFQQAQIRALQPQVQLPQQIGLTPTSAGPVFPSRSCTPSPSQTTFSVAPQSTPVTHGYSEQHNSPSLLSSSQVCKAT